MYSVDGGSVSVAACSFSRSSAAVAGGAIYARRAATRVSASNFTSCGSQLGGAMYHEVSTRPGPPVDLSSPPASHCTTSCPPRCHRVSR